MAVMECGASLLYCPKVGIKMVSESSGFQTTGRGFTTVIDPSAVDPNTLGEYLRARLFKPDPNDEWSLGCYTTFEVRDDAVELSTADDITGLDDDYITAHAYEWDEQGFGVVGGWYWDGDGTLVFEVYDSLSPNALQLRRIENHDCKKNYVWRDG